MVWAPGQAEVKLFFDDQGRFRKYEPAPLIAPPNSPLSLYVSFWRWNPSPVPPAYVPMAFSSGFLPRLVLKRDVDDDDGAALWYLDGSWPAVTGYTQNAIALFALTKELTDIEVNGGYGEVSIPGIVRVPLYVVIAKKGAAY